MHLRDELHISKPLAAGQEMALGVLLTREYLVRVLDERIFKPKGLTEPQYNILRILTGGPPEGYLIGELRRRMIARKADVPRLIDRMVASGWVRRAVDTADRRGSRVQLTPAGAALQRELDGPIRALFDTLSERFSPSERALLSRLIEQLRDEIRALIEMPRGEDA